MKDKILEILLVEYQLTNVKIEQFISAQFNTLNIILVTIGGFIVFTLSGNKESSRLEYLKFLPFLILLLLLLLCYHYQRAIGIQGYKKYLEYKINNIVGEDIIFYGHIGMKYMGSTNFFAVGNIIIYVAFYVFAILLVYKMIPVSFKLIYPYYIFCTALFLIFLIPMFKYTERINKLSLFINSNRKIIKPKDGIDEDIKYFKDNKLHKKDSLYPISESKKMKNIDSINTNQ